MRRTATATPSNSNLSLCLCKPCANDRRQFIRNTLIRSCSSKLIFQFQSCYMLHLSISISICQAYLLCLPSAYLVTQSKCHKPSSTATNKNKSCVLWFVLCLSLSPPSCSTTAQSMHDVHTHTHTTIHVSMHPPFCLVKRTIFFEL